MVAELSLNTEVCDNLYTMCLSQRWYPKHDASLGFLPPLLGVQVPEHFHIGKPGLLTAALMVVSETE